MIEKRKFLPIFVLQFIPIILYPLNLFGGGFAIVGFVGLLFFLLGYGIWRGRIWGLVMSVFIQGLNIVIRMMMFFPHSQMADGSLDFPWIITNLVAIILSGWFLLRLERPDIRSMIVA
jgi:hypothetical protein